MDKFRIEVEENCGYYIVVLYYGTVLMDTQYYDKEAMDGQD